MKTETRDKIRLIIIAIPAAAALLLWLVGRQRAILDLTGFADVRQYRQVRWGKQVSPCVTPVQMSLPNYQW